MSIKHKVIQNFQFISDDKKIFTLKSGIILENYIYKTKNEEILIDSDVINGNPDFFQVIDWKQELVAFMKQSKFPQPAILSKKLLPFLEEFIISDKSTIDSKKIDDLEKEYRIKIKSLSERESDCELKERKAERREIETRREYEEILIKESDIKKKLNELVIKEESIRDLEFEIGKRERSIDKNILESEKTIDERQRIMNDKLELKLKDLDKREEDFNLKMDDLSKRESLIVKQENLKSFDINKAKDIEDKIINLYKKFPWNHTFIHTGMGDINEIKKDIENIMRDFTELK